LFACCWNKVVCCYSYNLHLMIHQWSGSGFEYVENFGKVQGMIVLISKTAKQTWHFKKLFYLKMFPFFVSIPCKINLIHYKNLYNFFFRGFSFAFLWNMSDNLISNENKTFFLPFQRFQTMEMDVRSNYLLFYYTHSA
jgi:hypothetical protein